MSEREGFAKLVDYRKSVEKLYKTLTPSEISQFDEFIANRKDLLRRSYQVDLESDRELYILAIGIIRGLKETEYYLEKMGWDAKNPDIIGAEQLCGLLIKGLLD